MKIIRKAISILLSLSLCGLPALAADTGTGPSAWAKDEVDVAIELGFVPENLLSDYQKDITRDEFAQLAVSFCAFQLGYTKPLSSFLSDYQTNYRDGDGNTVSAVPESFSDATEYASVASGLGIVKGKGNGIYDPNGYITRQEAATMLLRAYHAYSSDNTSAAPPSANYADSAHFPEWAVESINQLYSWSVMTGDGNFFLPDSHYTREQSILTFLRLDRNAPYSRVKGGTNALIPYQAELEQILTPKDGGTFKLNQRLDNSYATILLGTEQSSTGVSMNRLWVIYTGLVDIGKQDLLPLISQDFDGVPEISNLSVHSDDTLSFTASAGQLAQEYKMALDSVYARPQLVSDEKNNLTALPSLFNALKITGFDGTYIYATTADGSIGVYSKDGRQIVSARAGIFSPAGEGLILLATELGLSYYTAKGSLLNEKPYAAGTIYDNGAAAVQQTANGDITIIDTSGNVLTTIPNTAGTIADTGFDSRCVLLKHDGKHVLLNTNTLKTLDSYQDAAPFSNGMAAVCSSGKWGFVDASFNLLIPCQFKAASQFKTGINIAVVQNQSGLYGTVDKRGRLMPIPFAYDALSVFNDFGYAIGQATGKNTSVLVSLTAAPVDLPTANGAYVLLGRAVATKSSTGQWTILGETGVRLFPNTIISDVFGSENSEELIVAANGEYFWTSIAAN